jgi:NAD(P)-dependent dehydrogenase (short-subunit alcohol dehydrogenase family)
MTGRVHLVTGAGRGIGRAIAARLVANGDSVAVVDLGCRVDGRGRDEEVATAAALELGGDCLAVTADVGDEHAVDTAVAAVLERWGRLDGVINAAALLRTGNVLTTTDDDWTSTLDVNLRGAMLISRAAIRSWVNKGFPGRVVNVTSTAGLEGNSEMFAYSVSKAGIVGLTLATSHAVACRDILVNAIAPLAATRMAIRGMGDEALTARDETGEWPDVAARGLTPERIAPLAAYLVSAGLGITGRIFTVGGGQAGLVPVPTPEASVEIDESSEQAEVDALLAATFAPLVGRSRWQADSLPLEQSEFPVAELDASNGGMGTAR